MSYWKRLRPNSAHNFYCVPLEIAEAEGNSFFGTEDHSLDIDGPWPFLAFINHASRPDILTFQCYTLFPEAQEFEGFNPLKTEGGYLSLDLPALNELINIFREEARKLAPPLENSHPTFKMLKGEEIAQLSLHPERFPKTNRRYYQQAYDSFEPAFDQSIKNIVTLSSPEFIPGSRIHLSIARFATKNIYNPTFDPTENALALINLDQNGIWEFTSLLEI